MDTSLVLILCGEVIIIYKYDFVKCILQLSNFAAQPMAYKPDGAWVYIFSWKYPPYGVFNKGLFILFGVEYLSCVVFRVFMEFWILEVWFLGGYLVVSCYGF